MSDRARLLADARIVRNRAKVDAFIRNARAFLALTDGAAGAFDAWLWRFVGGAPVQNRFGDPGPCRRRHRSPGSSAKALRGPGSAFVGPTICYAFMQSAGMVNDHLTRLLPSRGGGGARRMT